MDHIKNYKLTKIFRMSDKQELDEKLLNEFIQANIQITSVQGTCLYINMSNSVINKGCA